MTWGQFKEIVEKQGIKDSDMISYIDYLGMGEPRVVLREEPRLFYIV